MDQFIADLNALRKTLTGTVSDFDILRALARKEVEGANEFNWLTESNITELQARSENIAGFFDTASGKTAMALLLRAMDDFIATNEVD